MHECVSGGITAETAIRFASPLTPEQLVGQPENPQDSKVAVIFIINAKNGRLISYFASGNAREQERLFANGASLTVVAKSATF